MSARKRSFWDWSVNTTVVPVGRLHEKYEGESLAVGRESGVPTPRTWSPSSTTRSPRGPHDHSPAFDTANRHCSDPGRSGAIAHARPWATNVTTSVAGGTPPV